MNPKLSVIVVSYFCRDELRQCLNTLRSAGSLIEVFVIDNASRDGTREMLENEFVDWTNLKVTFNEQNVGLAEANNQPMAETRGDYVLILNPDTILASEALLKMVSYMDVHPDIGVVGPKHIYEDGTPHTSFHYGWNWFRMVVWTVVPYRIMRLLYNRMRTYAHRDVYFVSGACLLIRRELFVALQGYDKNYFLATEDVADLCLRVRQKGSRVVFYPAAQVIHIGACSSKKPSVKPFSFYKAMQGRLYFQKKHGLLAGYWSLYVIILANSAIKMLIYGLGSLISERYKNMYRVHVYALRKLCDEPVPSQDGEIR